MPSINWKERGITWVTETLSRRMGKNDTDKKPIGTAPIAYVSDVKLFAKEYGDECIRAIVNGTSLKVTSQDLGRRFIEKKWTVDQLERALDARLRGARSSSHQQVTVYALPNGETYSGTNAVEYRQLYAKALFELGIPGQDALRIASNIPFGDAAPTPLTTPTPDPIKSTK